MSDIKRTFEQVQENHKILLESGQIPKIPVPPEFDPDNPPRFGVYVREYPERAKEELRRNNKRGDDNE